MPMGKQSQRLEPMVLQLRRQIQSWMLELLAQKQARPSQKLEQHLKKLFRSWCLELMMPLQLKQLRSWKLEPEKMKRILMQQQS
ncbi:hypothetical protein E4U43_005106 [Claviceps pusilla]|uniref:Uncharacterized protein n=1 Tax=Claviceps pusilla TaxID=123648 RepID=A0A9P7T1M9_9HYPO|nr:hypothetical protein E4U43_005106 [Claviceps pusilla]